MAPVKTNHDYYAILQVPQTADSNAIKLNYRRLARARHPDKNRTNPNATSEFQLIQEAYTVLFDDDARRRYDLQYSSIKRTSQATSTPRTAPSSHETTKQQRTGGWEKVLQQLEAKRALQNGDLLEKKKVQRRLQVEVTRLKEEIDKSTGDIAAMGTTLRSLSSFVNRKTQKTQEQRDQAQRERLDKIAAQRIKENMLKEQEGKVRKCKASLRLTEDEITRVEHEVWMERVKEEEAREEAELRARETREEREAEELWKRREEAEEEERRRYEEEVEAERRRQMENPRTVPMPANNGCHYGGLWEEVEERMLCSRCLIETQQFAFQCPYCGKVACAPCRDALRGSRHS
ncbi:hypothetical protein FQN49_003424 [Arthroderma sp. PD_2]|nr:hypothetical protein FQN49_003424 [Arthroderma sp. PD_2]